MKSKSTIFSCFPQCQLSQLGIFEWIIILISISFVYIIMTAIIKNIFNSSKQNENSIRLRLQRFLFTTLVVGFISTAPLMMMFSYEVVRFYVKTILPILCVVTYLAWLITNKEDKT